MTKLFSLRKPVARTSVFCLSVVFVLLLCVTAQAQPYIVCDEYTTTMVQPEYFKVTLDGAQTQSAPETLANGSKRLHFDVGAVSVATHNFVVSACITDDWTGAEVCSETVPFVFTRPAARVVSKPSAIGLLR